MEITPKIMRNLRIYNRTHFIALIGWSLPFLAVFISTIVWVLTGFKTFSLQPYALLVLVSIAIVMTLPHIYPALKYRKYCLAINESAQLRSEITDSLIGYIQKHKFGIDCSYLDNLCMLGDNRKVDGLLLVLDDTNVKAKIKALKLLARLKDQKSLEPVERLTHDPNEKVRNQAKSTYAALTR